MTLVAPVGTPANQSFVTGAVPIVVGVLNPANSPQSVWDVGTAYEFASITTVVTGTPTSFTILLEGSLDGLAWTTLATASNTAGETQFSTGAVPFANLRARCTAVVGGSSPTVAIAAVAYQNPPELIPGGATPGAGTVSGTVTANQGTAAAPASAWPVNIQGTGGSTISSSGNQATVALSTQETSPASANVLVGNATTNAATIITVPQNKIWVGTITLSAAVVVAAGASGAINATPNVTTAGASAVPTAASVVCGLAISVGANLAGSVTADSANDTVAVYPVTIYAGASAAATLVLNFNSATAASAVAVGYLR